MQFEITAPGKDNVSKTGDNSNILLWSVLLVLSGSVLSRTAYKKRNIIDNDLKSEQETDFYC